MNSDSPQYWGGVTYLPLAVISKSTYYVHLCPATAQHVLCSVNYNTKGVSLLLEEKGASAFHFQWYERRNPNWFEISA